MTTSILRSSIIDGHIRPVHNRPWSLAGAALVVGMLAATFTRDENRLGSIEVGKLADLAVLSADVLDASTAPDDAIKRVPSILTIVGGRIVHDSRMLSASGPAPR